ncbi:MAG TPA: homoserine dehydrogenase, partial [Clostridia bacterium]|nr:homoserine dehydrogenase [Clostridia bacterium]
MKQINIALLGFGTVGTGVYKLLLENSIDIEHREGLSICVKRILVRDIQKAARLQLADRSLFTLKIEDILGDPSISVVVECMGGVEPSRTYILSALSAKKSVVTANKEVISKHWHTFEQQARDSGAGLYIEATVGGGIPLLRTLTDSLQANNITRLMGIINGTTNFILTRMSEKGMSFEEALLEAQSRGYAEADPASDIEGFDATYKLSILSSLAFHTHIPVDAVYREGISSLSTSDFEAARQLGYEIKLLAIGKKAPGALVEVRVHPTMLPKTHPLAAIRGSYNAVFITGNAVGDIMLYGKGAGQLPTASSVVSDIIYACHNEGRHRHNTFRNIPDMDKDTHLVTDWE